VLGESTVIARRGLVDKDKSTSSVAIALSEDALGAGLVSPLDNLNYIAGVRGVATGGQRGTTGSIFLRGQRPADVQLRVDGVRITNRSFALNSLLGTMNMYGSSELEVLKGGQSALYGAGANAGVLSLRSKLGGGDPSGKFFVEAGSFDSLLTGFEASGSVAGLSYFFGQTFETTSNDTYGGNSEVTGFDNDFVNYSTVMRVEQQVNDALALGVTFRKSDSFVDTPQFGGSRTSLHNHLATVYADYVVSDAWQAKFIVSFFDNSSDYENFGSFGDYQQFGVAWENTYQYSDDVSVHFGAEYEHGLYDDGSDLPSDHYFAAYVNKTIQVNEQLLLEGGLRAEDYSSFGQTVNWSAGFRYDLGEGATVIRGRAGTGFRAPTYPDLYKDNSSSFFGTDYITIANPDLDPEESLSWEFGVDQQVGDAGQLSLTYFEADTENLVQRSTAMTGPTEFTTTISNVAGKTKSNGIEAAFTGEMGSATSYSIQYTWLDNSFNDQPEQMASAQIAHQISGNTVVGAGAQYVDSRALGGDQIGDYLVARLFASHRLNKAVTLTARVENLFDQEYENFEGFGASYPARRLGAHIGAVIEW